MRKSSRKALALSRLVTVLATPGAISIVVKGAAAVLPVDLASGLRALVGFAARDLAPVVVARRSELTTQEAADLLGMSRQHLVRLVDAGTLSVRWTKAGTHRRLAADDVLKLKSRRDAERAHAKAITDDFERLISERHSLSRPARA
jgi:excisionase family DNA binding protein